MKIISYIFISLYLCFTIFPQTLEDFELSEFSSSTAIRKNGITWYFKEPVEYGQFINGDYWVIGPIDIIKITPEYNIVDNRRINGSMLNPTPGIIYQGYDDQKGYYKSDLNIASNISESSPLQVIAGSSVVSTQSNLEPINNNSPYILSASVLTVLSSIPPTDSFRPAYSDPNKTIYRASNIDDSVLLNLSRPNSAPDINSLIKLFENPWIDHIPGWTGRFHHPVDNMPAYGREISNEISNAALALLMDYPENKKDQLLLYYLQVGIDFYHIALNGGSNNWVNDGGHGSGRKWPILFAGLILNNDSMLSISERSGDFLYSGSYGPGNPPPDYIHFGEDDQTFYVTEDDVNMTLTPDSRDSEIHQYISNDIGQPEWGIRHATKPESSNKWWPTIYRECCTSLSWSGFTLAARLLNMKSDWNHDALFDYMDRYMLIESGYDYPDWEVPGEKTGWNSWQGSFALDSWNMYR